MKALLWKEYRQNQRFLVAAGILMTMPYLLAGLFALGDYLSLGARLGLQWQKYCGVACIGGMFMSALLGAFVAGTVVAGERADRSAEFFAYLPISRRDAITAKAIFALGTCLALWLVSVGAYLLVILAWPEVDPRELVGILTAFVLTGVLIFGVSWLFSTLLRSPAIAAGAGLISLVFVFVSAALIEEAWDPKGKAIEAWYPVVCIFIGVTCFAVGVRHYLRRIEP